MDPIRLDPDGGPRPQPLAPQRGSGRPVTGGDLIGRVLAGRYRLNAPVGSGASAQVYMADDVRLRRRVAVKVLHPGLAGDPTFLRRFQAEAQAAAALNHPNVLAVYDWGRDDEPGAGEAVPFLVTEYLDGGSLRAVLDHHRAERPYVGDADPVGGRGGDGADGSGQAGTLSLSQTLVVGLEVCRGLHYAHTRGFVHRDIKPANLLFGEDRRLRIADFGLARALAEASWTEPEGVVLGTARYASPEQAAGLPIDARSDLYSLALVLVECVTGRVPHTADTTLGTLRARIDRDIEVDEAVFGPLTELIEAAGRADPATRISSARFGAWLMTTAEHLAPPLPLELVPPERMVPARTPVADTHHLTPSLVGFLEPRSEPAAQSPERWREDITILGPAAPATAGLGTGEHGTGDLAAPGSARAPGDLPNGRPPHSKKAPSPSAGAAKPSGGAPTGATPTTTGAAAAVSNAPGRTGAAPTAKRRSKSARNMPPTTQAPSTTHAPSTTPKRSTAATASTTLANAPSARTGATAIAAVMSTAATVPAATPTGWGPSHAEAGAGSNSGGSRRRRHIPLRVAVVVVLLVAPVALLARLGVSLLTDGVDRTEQLSSTPATEQSHLVGRYLGRDLEDVRREIEQADFGWRLDVTEQRRDGTSPGEILEQDPPPGTELAGGDVLHLVRSSGDELVTVPAVVGQLIEDPAVGQAFSGATLLIERQPRFDENRPVGEILSVQNAGGQVEKRSRVAVVVSAGPEPRTLLDYITIDKKVDTVVAELGAAGLVAAVIEQASESVPEGRIIATEPAAGGQVPKGGTVKLVVSTGLPFLTVPDLAGSSGREAEDVLTAAGWQVRSIVGASSGVVIATDPPAGQARRKGSPIVIITATN